MMVSRTRGRKKPARPKRPYLSEWVLTQPSPRKEVLLQVFSGTSEAECARRLHLPLEEVARIARNAAKEAPLLMEDEFEMAYYSAHDAEEFYRVTGEGEGTYAFLSLRYPKAVRKAPQPSTATVAGGQTDRTTDRPQANAPTRKRKPSAARKATSTPKAGMAGGEADADMAAQPAKRANPNDPDVKARREARRAARELAAREREWERQKNW